MLENAETDTSVLVADVGDVIVLAFRGTTNLRDWITDIDFIKVGLDGKFAPHESKAKVHRGFLNAISSILPQIIGHLLPPGADKSKIKPIIITGHSLGGGLASEAAFFLTQQGFYIKAVYTFASPRVGNAAWRNAYNTLLDGRLADRSFRIACTGDLVPLIPGIFTPIRDGFRHVGREVLLDGGHMWIEPSHYLELALDGWHAYRAIKRYDFDFILQAHSITDDYQFCLNQISRLN